MVVLEYSVESPLNREPPVRDLVSSFITERGAYDRNHGPIPHIDSDKHIVRVDGAVNNILEFSVDQLKQDFPQHELCCALQCAGNRRHTMRTLLKEVDGIDWGDGAVMNCRWRGPRLRDILNKAGVSVHSGEKAHVAFACFQTPCQEDSWYGGSIDLERALREDGDVILALEMNGNTLPRNHGFPVRVVAPGIAGARSVKWLDRITVQLGESKNFYQQHDYKVLPPEATNKEEANKYWHTVPAIQNMPVNSVIAIPQNGDLIHLSSEGTTQIKGYALPEGDQGPVVQVEVSADEGKTWTEADIEHTPEGCGKWCWVLWKAVVKLDRGSPRRILSRATDKGGNVQAANPQWNLRGVAYNGYGESRDLEVV
ncbi:MAG: hypothetical protein M1812_001386 [Candelaria pacifica]|nr:MAG: hypothetical protein M1812_001386 [Candelaria pacifica]